VTVSSIMIYPPLVTINWIVFVLFPFENCPVTVPERLNNGGAAGAAAGFHRGLSETGYEFCPLAFRQKTRMASAVGLANIK